MDQAPELPPRPEKKTYGSSHFAATLSAAYNQTRNFGTQRNILNLVPPPCPAPPPENNNAAIFSSTSTPSSSSSSSNPSSRSSLSNSFISSRLPPPPQPLQSQAQPQSTPSNGSMLTPVPLSPSHVPSSVFNSFQENVLYSLGEHATSLSSPPSQSQTNGSPPRLPTRPNIISTGTGRNGDSHLIDWSGVNSTALSGSRTDNESERKEQVSKLILSMYNQQGQNGLMPGTPVLSPTIGTGVPINVPMMSPMLVNAQTSTTGLPVGINFVQNPLYTNQIAAAISATNGAGGFYPTTNASHLYSNVINNNSLHQPSYMNLPGHFATACSLASPITSNGFPLFPSNQDPQSAYLNEMINKINNNSQQAQSPKIHQKPILTPTSLFDTRQLHSSQSIIDQFDPLSEVETDASLLNSRMVTSSPIPPPPAVSEEAKYENSEDIKNNNKSDREDTADGGSNSPASNRNSYRNSHNEPINLLQIEQREVKYATDQQEFFEHLRALYMSICSKNSPLANSGLVWSPRIDITNTGDGLAADTYMCSPATQKQKSVSLSSSHSSFGNESDLSAKTAIFDIRFNSLVFNKLAGEPTASVDAILKSDSVWHSRKLTCSLDNSVEMIVTYVSFNMERNEAAPEINYDDFLLKINGRNEYLVPKSILSSYVYIQQCKKMNQDIVLELVDHTLPEFWRPFLRSDQDYSYILSDFTPEQLLPKTSVASFVPINAGQLNRLLEELNMAFAQFLSMTDIQLIIQERSLFNDITSKIEELCCLLSRVKTYRLKEAIDDFTKYYEKHIINNGTGSGGVISTAELLAYFNATFSKLLNSFSEIIYLYSKAFPVNFELNPNDCPRFPTRTDDITKHIETFKLKPDVVAQVPKEWRSIYYFYSLRATITHGYKVLDFKYSDRHVADSEWRLEFPREMVFENTIISELPREARVEFHLLGVKTATMATSKIDVDVLASSFFYVFDRENEQERSMYRHGRHLVPMTIFKQPHSFTINSYETLDHHVPVIYDSNYLVSYNLDPSAPMLVFALSTNNHNVQYYYPKVVLPPKMATLEINRSTFDRKSLRLDTPVPLNRSISTHSNASITSGGSNPDSLYGFYGRSTDRLDRRNRQAIISIVQRNPLDPLSREEKAIIWENRDNLTYFPGAILKILRSPPRWSYVDVKKVSQLLDSFDYFKSPDTPSLSPSAKAAFDSFEQPNQKLPFCTAIEALQLLSSDYPDQNVRVKAVRWLKTVSTDELCDFLPQLVQSLRYEPHLDCCLIWLLFECSLTSSRFCHHFYWLLKSCLSDSLFGARCQFYLNSLLILCGHRVRQMFEKQELLCTKLEQICADIKQSKENMRQNILKQRLEAVNEFLESCPISIPLSPSIQVCGLEIGQCSYFSSNSLPLKIVFQGAPPYGTSANMIDSLAPTRPNLIASIYEQKKQMNKVIFKCGDDLRQDMLVMQIISIINRIWIRASLDLRLITFGVMNNADRTGMIELVSRARTLRQIQVEYGVTGNFKHHTIANWLKRHNPGEFEYMMAVENFIHSCAGYVVITYLLGICDRHNDNIMVTTSGHLFHIDFGKFLGDAQMISGIKRDRAPFVFTADMAYVINEGDKPSKNYQFFVDLCCRCFSQVRQNGNFLLSLLSMMIPSGIFGLSSETIRYFHNALMPELTDSQAQAQFYRLIEKALGSFATQLNFFMHTLAQLRFNSSSQADASMYYAASNGSNSTGATNTITIDTTDLNDQSGDGDSDMPSLELESVRFSFSSKRFTEQQEGHIMHLEIVDIWKRYMVGGEKDYYYKVKVDRQNVIESIVYRSFKEFIELSDKLTRTFTLVKFYRLSRSKPNTRDMADQRKDELQQFLTSLLKFNKEISHSDIVYTFFHFIHRDQQFLESESGPNFAIRQQQPSKIKLVINYHDDALHVLVMYGRNLETLRNASPDTYVKLYLKPDPNKATKQKTRVISKNANPTYMHSIVYSGYKMDDIKTKALEVSVWANDISGNSRIGGHVVYLKNIDLGKKTEAWYRLQCSGQQ